MQRFTISLPDDLALKFDGLVAERQYGNRSEAVRDLIREHLDQLQLRQPHTDACGASVSFVYQHDDRTMIGKLLALQHEHHDLVVTSQHVHLDHHFCLETVVLRGPAAAVQRCAEDMLALRGIEHGQVHYIPLLADGEGHVHPGGGQGGHRHFVPAS